MILNPTEIGAWRSLVARLLWEQEVGGSNPLAPTSFNHPELNASTLSTTSLFMNSQNL